MSEPRPRIALYSLGGTIASTAAASETGVAPQLTADDLLRAVPKLGQIAQIDAVQARQVPGGDLTLHDLVAVAAQITQSFVDGAIGAVVTQGTDTIEESAFALGILVASPKPVVVTGAMRNPTLPGADGPANLLAAVQVASSPEAQGLGCVVVLNDEIHANRFVRKTHTTSTSAFRSPLTGPIGWVHEGRPRVVARHSPHVHADIAPATEIPPVALLKVGIGADSRLLGEILGLGYAGLVVEGFGGGHVPGSLAPMLGELAARMPVVLASRTGSGEVLRETYGFVGSESDLFKRGLISAGLLDGLKSRVLLSLLLASGASRDAIAKSFAEMSD